MPKLSSKIANTVDNTEPMGGFEPLKPGKYLGRLAKVEVREKPNKYGAAQWSAEFDNLHTLDGETVPGRQWFNLTIPSDNPAMPGNYEKGTEQWEKYQGVLAGVLAGFFQAFGYTADSDTDEMIGEWAVLNVKITTIQAGPREGEKTNTVQSIESAEDFDTPEIADEDDTY